MKFLIILLPWHPILRNTTDGQLTHKRIFGNHLTKEAFWTRVKQKRETVVGKQFVLTADTLPWGHQPLLCSPPLCFVQLFFYLLCYVVPCFTPATLPWGQLSPGTNPHFFLSRAGSMLQWAVKSMLQWAVKREKVTGEKNLYRRRGNPTVCSWKLVFTKPILYTAPPTP